jgi:hypothetical protein
MQQINARIEQNLRPSRGNIHQFVRVYPLSGTGPSEMIAGGAWMKWK